MCVKASLVGLLHLFRLPVLHVCRDGGGAIWPRLLKGHTNISGELVRVLTLSSYSMFAALVSVCFELYQCYMQRISRNIIDDLTRAQGA